MDSKYINEKRYKKSSSLNKSSRRKESVRKKISNQTNQVIKKEPVKEVNKPKKQKKTKKKIPVALIYLIIICVLIAVSVILRFVLKDPDEGFFDIFKIDIPSTMQQQIAISTISEELDENNVIVRELDSYVGELLLEIDSNYAITYNVVSEVKKSSNSEYLLYLKNGYDSNFIISYIESLRDTSYIPNVENIKHMESVNTSCIKVELYEEDPLFIYNLQIPIGNNGNYTKLNNSYRAKGEMPGYISEINMQNMTVEEALKSFNDKNTHMIITGNLSVRDALGKNEYDISSYKTGEMLVLFGNPNSKIFSRKEVRQAIAYSINRQEILKNIYFNMGEIIDLPFIYSQAKYKYDIYDATNILLTNRYTLADQVFYKYESDGFVKLSLDLLVNEADDEKIAVANKIKEDLAEVGIEINIEKLNKASIKSRVQNGDYDLLLAEVNVNENPSVDFLQEYIVVNDAIKHKLDEISDLSDIVGIDTKIKELIELMSEEIACIVIHADSAYVFSQKNLADLNNIYYLNLFNNILKR